MRERYVNQPTGIEVNVTKPASLLIGPQRVPQFVARLTEFMADLGLKWAIVSRCGSHLSVNLGA